jgi:hypothetical protein
MMNEYRFVGETPTTLEDGRPIEPGEFVGVTDISEKAPHNKMLYDEGKLIPGIPTSDEKSEAASIAKARAANVKAEEEAEGEEAETEAETSEEPTLEHATTGGQK